MLLADLLAHLALQIAATRLEAIKYYQDFINTFRSPMQADGALPDRVDDAANERFFLMASFSLGRVMAGRVADRCAVLQQRWHDQDQEQQLQQQ